MGAAIPGNAGVYNFGLAANAGSFRGQTVLTNAALNVAGQLVTIPVGMRVAANAASVAASYSFGNPLLFAGALAFPYAYNYWTAHKLKVNSNGVWELETVSPGTTTQYSIDGANWFASKADACNTLSSSFPADSMWTFTFAVSGTRCSITSKYRGPPPAQAGGIIGYQDLLSRVSNAYVSEKREAAVSDFQRAILEIPLPDEVIKELPVDWPVEKPQLNPDPDVEPQPNPAPAPASRPSWIPIGDPIKQPSTEGQPDTWKQPGVRVTPAPTDAEPWRVDVTPEDKVKNDPTPNDSDLPTTDPSNPSDPETVDFCQTNPDVLACQKLDTPDGPDLETKDKSIAITPQTDWGFSDSVCPSPRHLSSGVLISFEPYCDFMSGIRPVVIAVAWLSAALILLGFGGKGMGE